MTLLQSPTRSPFESTAQAEIRGLLRSNQARAALNRLSHYEPGERSQAIQFHALRARALDQLGESRTAIHDWARALHLTSRMRELRARVRISMTDSLSRAGDLARAERVVQRCVAEIRATGEPAAVESTALATLARIHTRRGTLTLATRLNERALALESDGVADSAAWVALRVNYAHALIRLGEFARAKAVLDEVDDSGRAIDSFGRAAHSLTRITLALEADDLEAGKRALSRVDEQVLGDHARYRLVWVQYRAAVRLAEGWPREALELAEQALEVCRAAPTDHDDMVAELSRLRACALLELGRFPDALQSAREAIQASGGSDCLDYPAGLRVEGRCLAALGRREEARTRLATALSHLESTEFLVERRRLYRDMEALGMPLPTARSEFLPGALQVAGSGASAQRITLEDGRNFVTSDRELVGRIRSAAESRLPVLIEGETGTGKERVARLLHELGNSRGGPFVVVDCTTLSETLAEAELFGVARGAYTGAATDRAGLVGAANGGTLLFDELPQLSLSAQSKLLRLLQEGTYRRLGEARSRSVTVRVVATTNQDPERLLASGALKPDLFFRLHGHRIRLSPLRERPRDIALLAQEFAGAEGLGGVQPEAMARLEGFAWPGNARQLEMLVRVAAAGLGPGRWLEDALVVRLLDDEPRLPAPSSEQARLRAALDRHSGNVAATARSLHMSRQGLYKALRRHGLM